jgi:hypothetical protein
MRKFVVATRDNCYDFSPTAQKVVEAEGVKEAAIAYNNELVEAARTVWQERKDTYDAQEQGRTAAKPAATKGGGRAKAKKAVVRNPGEFKEPKAQAVIVLDVENNEWHTVSVSPPPPPPREQWDWTVKSLTTSIEDLDEDEDEDDEF